MNDWFKDGLIDGLLVKPWVLIWTVVPIFALIIVGVLWGNNPNMSFGKGLLWIGLGFSAWLTTACLGFALGALVAAWPLKTYWNWRVRKLHSFVHGEDGTPYQGQGSLSFWGAFVVGFAWQAGQRAQLRSFKAQYQLALARKLGYS